MSSNISKSEIVAHYKVNSCSSAKRMGKSLRNFCSNSLAFRLCAVWSGFGLGPLVNGLMAYSNLDRVVKSSILWPLPFPSLKFSIYSFHGSSGIFSSSSVYWVCGFIIKLMEISDRKDIDKLIAYSKSY